MNVEKPGISNAFTNRDPSLIFRPKRAMNWLAGSEMKTILTKNERKKKALARSINWGYIDKIKNNEPIHLNGDGESEINMVFVQDVVKVLEKLVDKDELDNDILNVCGNDSFSLLDFINTINDKYYQKTIFQ